MRHFARIPLKGIVLRSPLAELGAFLLALAALALLELPLAAAPAGASTRIAPGELYNYRTASSRTYDNHDGTFTSKLWSGPVHYRDQDGDWRPISSALVPTDEPGYAWQNEGNSFHAFFADQLGEAYLELQPAGESRAFQLSLTGGAQSEAVTRERGLTYPGIFPGVDLSYDLRPDGIKESLLLANAAVPLTYHFLLRSPAGETVQAEPRPDGSWAFSVAPHSQPAFVLEAPWAAEQGWLPPELPHASLDVTRQGDDFDVTLSLNADWLHDPLRLFPIEVDPTITIQPDFQDASFNFACSTCTGVTSDRLSIGTTTSGSPQTWRSALQFTLSDVPSGATVSSANLKLYFDGTCLNPPAACGATAHQIDVLPMTSSWSPAKKVSQLTFGTSLGSYTLPLGASAQWMSWDITQRVKDWLTGQATNYGLLLKRNPESLNASGPRPPSRNYAPEPTLGPMLEVTYNGQGGTLLDPDTLHANGAELRWVPYSGPGAPPFSSYEVHRSTSTSFTPSATTRLTTIGDAGITSYTDTTAKPGTTFTYKVLVSGVETNARTVALPAAGQSSKLLRPDPSAGMDTFITQRSDSTDCTNHGAEAQMKLGTDTVSIWRPLVRFDLSDVPASATVSSASLSLWHPDSPSTALTVKAHRLTGNWDSGAGSGTCSGDGATWYESTGAVRWKTDGGDVDPLVAASGSIASGAAAGWSSFTLTSLVQDWVSGGKPNDGVLLKLDDETRVAGKAVSFYTSDFTIAPTLRPKLAVTYTDGSQATAPTVAVSKPKAGELVRGTVTITAGAFDDRRVDSVQFFVDGNSLGTDTSEPFSVSWNSAGVANGSHSLTARATDDAGNQTTSAAVSVSVANVAAPTTAITSPTGGNVSGVVSVTASASTGVTKVEFYADGKLFATDTTSPYTVSWNTLDPALPAYDGSHTLTSQAYDGYQQVTTSSSVTVTAANIGATQFKATLSSSNLPERVQSGPGAPASYPVDVTVTNASNQAWAATVVLKYRWYVAGTSTPVSTGNAVPVGPLPPTGSIPVHVDVIPPALPDGAVRDYYRLRLDLYDGTSLSWFADHGNKPLETTLVDENPPEVPKLGLEPYYTYDSEQLGPNMQNFVNVASGNSVVRWRPLSAPGIGLSTVVQLTYNSLDDLHGNCPAEDCPAGDGWTLSISGLARFGHQAFRDRGQTVEFDDADGTTHKFTRTQTQPYPLYQPEAGLHLYLRKDPPGEPGATWAVTRPDRLTYYFDSHGEPLALKDKNGNRLTFVLEPTGNGDNKRVKEVRDQPLPGQPQGRPFTLTYYDGQTENKRLKEISDHSGHKLQFFYGEHSEHTRLERVTEVGGTNADGTPLADRSFHFDYGPPNQPQLTAVQDPLGYAANPQYSTSFSYYATNANKDRLATRTDRESKQTQFLYPTNTTTTVRDPLNHDTTYRHLTDTTNDGSVDLITNAIGEQTQIVWTTVSPLRHVQKVIEPSLKYREFTYNHNGLVLDSWDQLRNRTQRTYINLAVDERDDPNQGSISLLHTITEPKGGNPWRLEYDTNSNLTQIFDPTDTVNPFESFDYYAAGGSEPVGMLKLTRDGNSKETNFSSYDANGFPQTVTDAQSHVTTYAHDANGLLLSVQDARHQGDSGGDIRDYRTVYDYDSFHRLGRTSTPKSTKFYRGWLLLTSVGYDANDNVLSARQPGDRMPGAETTMNYDRMDRRKFVNDPLFHKTSFTYDDVGRLIKTKLPLGQADPNSNDYVTENVYDALDRLITQIRYPKSTEVGLSPRKTHYCYQGNTGDLLWVTAPKAGLGSPPACNAQPPQPPLYTTRYGYDDAHKLTSVTEPWKNGLRTRLLSYDANGNVETSTDELNTVTSFTYTDRDELKTKVETFDKSSTPVRRLTTKYGYDRVGNLLYEVSPRAWDACAPTTGGCDPGADGDFVTAYRYDQLNRLNRIALPKKAGAGERPRTYMHRSYDANGNLTKTTLPVADSELGTLCTTSPKFCADLTYFDPGWIATTDDHVNPLVDFDYRPEGLQKRRHSCKDDSSVPGTDTICTTRTWIYFDDGTLKERHVLRNGRRGGDGNGFYTYDADQNLKTANVADSISKHAIEADYNGFDELSESRQRNDSAAWAYTNYDYDANGNVSIRWDNGSGTQNGRRHDFGYDEADELTLDHDGGKDGQSTNDDLQTSYDYKPTGWQAQRKVQHGPPPSWQTKLQTDWEYFDNGDLKTLTTRNATTSVESHTLSYLQCADGSQSCGASSNKLYLNGNRTQDDFTLHGANLFPTACESSCTTYYHYDPRETLVEEDAAWRPTGQQTNSWTPDDQMNVTDSTVAGISRHYVYSGNQLQRMETADQQTVLARYFYDLDGNLYCATDAGGSEANCPSPYGATPPTHLLETYKWDFLGRLQHYQRYGQSAIEASYDHDALDRLVREWTKVGATERTNCFTYLGLSGAVGEETRVPTIGAASCGGTPTFTKSYSYDAELERTAVTVTGSGPNENGDFYFGRNVHGDVSLLLKNDGTRKTTHGYLPYGQDDPALDGGENPDPNEPFNPYRFNDRRLDPASGSEDMGARRYGAGLGRFLQQDFLPGAEDDLGLSLDPLSANRYAFAAANPLSFVETDGHRFAFRETGSNPRRPDASAGLSGGQPSSTTRHFAQFKTHLKSEPCPVENRTAGYKADLSCTRYYPLSGDSIVDLARGAGHAAVELSGYRDFQRCLHGDGQSCGWAAAGVLPVGKVARVAKATHDVGRGARAAHDIDRAAEEAGGGAVFFRGARAGERPTFVPRENEFRVDRETGLVRPTHGVSVFDNPQSVISRGFEPHEIDPATIPDNLTFIQRGEDLAHYEIVPRPGANLTPERYICALGQIRCR